MSTKQYNVLDRIPAIHKRNSEYSLSNEEVAPLEQVEKLLGDLLENLPTAFNSQPVRMVLLTGKAHKDHWNLISDILIQQIGEERFNDGTKQKIEKSFASGIGTVLFFDDTEVTEKLKKDYPNYAHNFEPWASQVQGSHQLMTWLGLTDMGYGANLQHYIGMDDDRVRKQVNVPDTWRFVAHMPFGKVVHPESDKPSKPLSEMLKVIND